MISLFKQDIICFSDYPDDVLLSVTIGYNDIKVIENNKNILLTGDYARIYKNTFFFNDRFC